jgi:hypothetical protein
MTHRPPDAARFRVDSDPARRATQPTSRITGVQSVTNGPHPIQMWGRSGQRECYDCFDDPCKLNKWHDQDCTCGAFGEG